MILIEFLFFFYQIMYDTQATIRRNAIFVLIEVRVALMHEI